MSSPIPLPTGALGAGQATLIEQSRAQAEVLAAVHAARSWPRSMDVAVNKMMEACRQPELAARAFFRFSRGGQVTGASIHLARAIAACYGNVQYGITELSRERDHSQMLAFAWDLESNTRPTTTFIVPHVRSAGKSLSALEDPRDIYENNANMGARRVREMIFAVLPVWFVERAKAQCRSTIENKDSDVPMPERRARVVRLFEELGVSRQQLVDKLGRAVDDWTPPDMATLQIVYGSIKAGEATRDDEFPPIDAETTAESVRSARRERPRSVTAGQDTPAPPTPEATPAPATPGRPSTVTDHKRIMALLRAGGVTGQAGAAIVVSKVAGLPAVIGSLSQVSAADASKVINTLTAWQKEAGEDTAAYGARVDAMLPPDGDRAWDDAADARAAYEATKEGGE